MRFKRIMVSSLCAAILITSVFVGSALAMSDFDSPLNMAAAPYTVTLNGKALDLSGVPVSLYDDNGNVMIPLRKVAEAMGYTVSWIPEKYCARIENAEVFMDILIGKDSYGVGNNTVDDPIVPESCGSAPVIKGNGYTFVPAKMFSLLLCDVTVKDGIVSITTESAAQLPNPMISYDTVSEAEKAVGFPLRLPASMKDVKAENIFVINDLVQINYKNGVHYRIAKGTDDISGDYNQYESTQTLTIGSYEVTAKGDGDRISLATFNDGEYCYSVSLEEGMTPDELTELIDSIA